MITNFKEYNLITESPDLVFIKEHPYVLDIESPDSIPFFCEVDDEHTEIKNVHVGEKATFHGDMKQNNSKGVYFGRLWLDSKVISFWIYPKDDLFISIIKKMEEQLNTKIFNNNWKIEIVEKNNTIIKTKDSTDNSSFNVYDYEYDNGKTKLIFIDQYVGSENFTEKEKLWHLMNVKEKQKAIRNGKSPTIIGGSHLTAWDQPKNIKWRQALRQESKKN